MRVRALFERHDVDTVTSLQRAKGLSPCAHALGHKDSSNTPAVPPTPCHRSDGRDTAARLAGPCARQVPAPTAAAFKTLDKHFLHFLQLSEEKCPGSESHMLRSRTLITTAVTDLSMQKYVSDLRQQEMVTMSLWRTMTPNATADTDLPVRILL